MDRRKSKYSQVLPATKGAHYLIQKRSEEKINEDETKSEKEKKKGEIVCVTVLFSLN